MEVETIMNVVDNFNEGELELNLYGSEYTAPPVTEHRYSEENERPRKCIRKGDIVCYVKDENINMMPNNESSSAPQHSTESKTHVSTETDDILSGESIYKTFIFEESLNDADTQKCIAFWKSVMEKNLKPIKCSIIESKKPKEKELKIEPERKTSPVEDEEDKIKEATDKVHAEYKKLWTTALTEIKRKKLDEVKMIGRARCKLCETIETPIEEYVTDTDNVKEEVKNLNKWESVSKSKQMGRAKGPLPEEIRKLIDKDKNYYKFVNVVEQKKKTGAYKLWRSNKVRPPCACGKAKCECNINPAIISMRTPLAQRTQRMPEPKPRIAPKKTVPSKPPAAERPPIEEKPWKPPVVETPVKPPVEEKPMEPPEEKPVKPPIEEKPAKPPMEERTSSLKSVEEKKSIEKTSKEFLNGKKTPEKDELPSKESESKPPAEDKTYYKQVDSISSVGEKKEGALGEEGSGMVNLFDEDFTQEVASVFVAKAKPFIEQFSHPLTQELSVLSALPYAAESTFLKVASISAMAEDLSTMFLKELREVSQNLFSEAAEVFANVSAISGIVPFTNPATHFLVNMQEEVEEEEEPDDDDEFDIANDPLLSKLQGGGERTETPLKKTEEPLIIRQPVAKDDDRGSLTSLSGIERQVSILLPTGEVEIIAHARSETDNEDFTWEKPKVHAPVLPVATRKGSLEILKTKQMGSKEKNHQATTPEIGTQATTPGIGTQTTPEIDPQVTTPGIGHQATTPKIGPQATTPEIRPQANTPGIGPQATTPAISAQATSRGMNTQTTNPGINTQANSPGTRPQGTNQGTTPKVAGPGAIPKAPSVAGPKVAGSAVGPRVAGLEVGTGFSASTSLRNTPRGSQISGDVQLDNLQILLSKELKEQDVSPTPTEITLGELYKFEVKDSSLYQKEQLEKRKEWKKDSDLLVEGTIQIGKKIQETEKVINPALIKDSIAVTKEMIAKHQQENAETSLEDLGEDAGNTLVHVQPEPAVAYIGPGPGKVFEIKDSVDVRKKSFEKMNLRSLTQNQPKDSIFIHKDYLAKRKKRADQKDSGDYQPTGIVYVSGETEKVGAKIDPRLLKDSVYVQKKHMLEQKKGASKPFSKQKIHPSLIKDSVYVQKKQIAKRREDAIKRIAKYKDAEFAAPSEVIYETDYNQSEILTNKQQMQVDKEKSQAEQNEVGGMRSEPSQGVPLKKQEPISFPEHCDPCYCSKCPCVNTASLTPQIGKGKKMVAACPLNARHKKYKRRHHKSPSDNSMVYLSSTYDDIFLEDKGTKLLYPIKDIASQDIYSTYNLP